jgi:molybdopterin adenylyltransferase
MFEVAIITASDKGSRGEREDLSGKKIAEIIEGAGYGLHSLTILPDEVELLANKMKELATADVALVLTTGGTGFSPRDCTPEATLSVIERNVPGIPEAMRYKSLQITDRAMLSRAVAGIRGRTLIVNLPGSPKAVTECLEFILPSLDHGLKIMRGEASECAR